MTCQELAEFVLDYLDGQLAPDERARFDEHLALCPACVIYLDTYQRTVALARAAARVDEPAPPAMPEELVHAILAARGKH